MPEDYGLEELRTAAQHAAVRVPTVSNWSVGMHVHHCCLAATGVCRALAGSDGPPPRTRFSLLRWLVLSTGRIPRGRGKSPESAVPGGDASPDDLQGMIERCGEAIGEAGSLGREAWFRHFAFGVLDRDAALKFIRIHTRHHLRIISDIVGARSEHVA